MVRTLRLPTTDRSLEDLALPEDYVFKYPNMGLFISRTLIAAPHVVVDPRGEYTPGMDGKLDIEATVRVRRDLWDHGMGVADAMSTAERGPGGISWKQTQELLDATSEAARDVDGLLLGGVGTDQYQQDELCTLAEVTDAFLEQLRFVQSIGVTPILRGSHQLTRIASSPKHYRDVYRAILDEVDTPIMIHWSGAVFQPAFAAYWGSDDLEVAMGHFLDILEASPGKVSGVKLSVMDTRLERDLRERLPNGCSLYTGDDYHYADLIVPEDPDEDASHALLGVLATIAPVANNAMHALDAGRDSVARDLLRSSEPLARRLFETPAALYPAGIVFLSYLNGYQDHFRMITGREGSRSILHLAEVFRSVVDLGLLKDAPQAFERFRPILLTSGVAQPA